MKRNNLHKGFCLVIVMLIGFVIGAICANNNNLITKQTELIRLQSCMIDDLANHLWNDHNCELPQMDGMLIDSIHSLELEINDLYE